MSFSTPLGFDKEKFQRKESLVFEYFTRHLDNGPMYAIAENTQQPFFYVEWAKYFLVFKINREEFVFKKKLFRNEKTLDWNRLRKIGKNTLKMSNQEIEQSNVRLTVINLYQIFGGFVDFSFNDSLREKFEEASFEKVLAKKFELDKYSSHLQLKQILREANINDPLYNEIKFETKRTGSMHQTKEQEYRKELRDFHSRMRGNEQLKVISQSVKVVN